MNYLDFAILMLGSTIFLMAIVSKNQIEKSRVRIKVKVKK